MGHLWGVAKGWGGAGVLTLDIENLETAAQGAARMGNPEIAEEIRGWKERLPAIRTSAQAQATLQEFEELAQRSWQLGVKCGRMRHGLPGMSTSEKQRRTSEDDDGI